MLVRVALCSVFALTAGCTSKKLRTEMEDLRAKMAEIEEEGASTPPKCEVPDHSFTDERLLLILGSLGADQFSVTDCGAIYYRVHGLTLALKRLADGDLLLTYAATGCDWSLSQINDWNRTKRLSRAYIDEEGDPVLEADLISDTGITEEQVAVFVDVFHASVHSYSTLLAEYCGAGPAPQPSSDSM